MIIFLQEYCEEITNVSGQAPCYQPQLCLTIGFLLLTSLSTPKSLIPTICVVCGDSNAIWSKMLHHPRKKDPLFVKHFFSSQMGECRMIEGVV